MQLTGAGSRGLLTAPAGGNVWFFLLAALVLVATAGRAAATEVRQIVVSGEQRSYRLYVPPDLRTKPVPVVIALHGAVQSAAEFERDLGLNRIARREKFAVAYPEGINRVWDDARPPMMRLGYVVPPGDDVAFITAMVRRLVNEGIADPKRVYMAGLSMGGFMAARLACERAELFAAVAMMAATVPEQYRQTCNPRRPLPAMLIHGTFDPIIPYFGVPMGGSGILSAADTAQFFADLSGCMAYADSARPSLDRSGNVEIRRWSICRNNASVMLYKIPGGGHLPPSAEAGRGDTFVSMFLLERSHAIDTAEEMWGFFSQFRAAGVQRGTSAQ
ncbi:MAG: prolyl oligopeptidase family serine peptidase [Bradyrhizobiaceae bacterium]|nr:prolyl oligopeptidase family serine peptidase [Bradyrhizobiaceae bacterium]